MRESTKLAVLIVIAILLAVDLWLSVHPAAANPVEYMVVDAWDAADAEASLNAARTQGWTYAGAAGMAGFTVFVLTRPVDAAGAGSQFAGDG